MTDGIVPTQLHAYRNNRWETTDAAVIEERLISIFVNGEELATIMATPRDQAALALGFLANEGLIAGRADVRATHVCPSGTCVDVWLRTGEFKRPERRILTSGCGGGVTFTDLAVRHAPIESDVHVAPQKLLDRLDELQRSAELYREVGGVHACALTDGERLLVIAEDIGRHNTIDKVRGLCLLQDIDPRGRILLCTGRISSEMLGKARQMGVPIVGSRTSPTSLSVKLGQAWGLTVIGYMRRGRLMAYSCPERLQSNGTASESDGQDHA